MRRIAVLLTMLGVACALATQAGAAGKPSISIVRTGVKAGAVTVTVKVANWRLLPAQIGKQPNAVDGGHWHLYVDGKYVAASGALTAASAKLSSGAHRLRVELVNNDHSRLAPPVGSATVTVKVTTAGGAGAASGVGPPIVDNMAGGDMYGY